MRNALQGVALTLASCGLLVGARPTTTGEALHETVRARVLQELGTGAADARAVRRVLREDPDFDQLMDEYRELALGSVRRAADAEDAAQDTMLKVWSSHAQVLLRPYPVVRRYLRTAARHNLVSQHRREARATSSRDASAAVADLAVECGDPADRAAANELLAELDGRIDADESAVVAERLSGVRSVREVARATGLTRHAVQRSDQRIATVLRELVAHAES